MKRVRAISILISGMVYVGFAGQGNAATIQTIGPGSAVTSVDLSATFDTLTFTNVVHLDTYVEGALSVTTSGDSWAADLTSNTRLDPFHGAGGADRAFYAIAWGNQDWVTIQTTNLARIHGVEFMYGNGWTTGDIYGQYPWGNALGFVEWQTFDNGTLVSAGQIGPNPVVPMGTVLGFYDPAGFDQLLVRCRIANTVPTNSQAIALDNLQVMLTNLPPVPAIYGSDFGLTPGTGVPTLTVYDTIPGCQYRMVFTQTLGPATWSPVTPPLPDGWQPGGGALTFADPGATGGPRRFYRVEVR